MTGDRKPPGPDDWRRRGQEAYLKGKRLIAQEYRRYSPTWDHDHCGFCWATFSEEPGDLHEGYATQDDYTWICRACFEDFKDEFHWSVDDPWEPE